MRPMLAAAVHAESSAAIRRFVCAWSVTLLMFAFGSMALRAAPDGTTTDLDRANGLPDAQIGAPLQTFHGLQKTEDTGRWLSFVRPSDKLEYAGYPVKSITYNFFKERLYSIFIEVDGKRSTKGLLKALEQQFGKQHSYELHTYPKTAAQLEIREWAGAKVYCVYKSGSDFQGGLLTLLDRPTWDLLQVPKREKEAQTRDMLKGSFIEGDF